MGTITINVDDQLEQQFRATVEQKLGTGKGKLGQAVQEALDNWIARKRQYEISERQVRLVKEGMPIGAGKWSRSDMHER
ncbi:hypothetical protein COV20_04715 [Candidatus Woesearchaeota archaeon CG10_big_fil_rev_8_21_14_0_10_45_16]|nr:MAG: hypothetical protein COV20_04715 [Candidatus Woesearchaeota archaeon CG10_big_fil_rev_8_21_14_0_10_45_16]